MSSKQFLNYGSHGGEHPSIFQYSGIIEFLTRPEARSFIGFFRELKPLCGHLFEDGARLLIGCHLCQLKAIGGKADVSLSLFECLLVFWAHHPPPSGRRQRDFFLGNEWRPFRLIGRKNFDQNVTDFSRIFLGQSCQQHDGDPVSGPP
jgi:hypothetical protein